MKNGKIAVFIDGPNAHAASKALGFDMDFRRLKHLFQTKGTLIREYYHTTVIDNDDYSAIQPLLLLVAGFSMASNSMASHCNNAIYGGIDRAGQKPNCFEGRNDEKPEMAADSNEFGLRAIPAICLTASEHRKPGPGAEIALA